MTEREKMEKGLWYVANFNPELKEQREKAHNLCFDYNHTRPSLKAERQAILNELFGGFPEDSSIAAPFVCDFGRNIKLGRKVVINTNCYFMDGAPITVGDGCFIGPSCGFYTANYPLEAAERRNGLEQALPIHIGNEVWIGPNVIILPGVTIGEGSVIAAGSLVTRDIPPYCLAVGNPCQVIKRIEH